ncbi:MAG: hypothetical protein LW628_04220 [Fimbriimonadaceae bacterium]|nr:hypothetical protein [Fimbriimonadaceae bacterium]
MQYLVVAEDGNKYGPADYDMLVAWVAEGRIVGQTLIEDVKTGRQTIASSIPGLIAQPPVQPSIQTASPVSLWTMTGAKNSRTPGSISDCALSPSVLLPYLRHSESIMHPSQNEKVTPLQSNPNEPASQSSSFTPSSTLPYGYPFGDNRYDEQF